jgi:hypothetical protein
VNGDMDLAKEMLGIQAKENPEEKQEKSIPDKGNYE